MQGRKVTCESPESNLRREHRFLANVEVNEQRGVGQNGCGVRPGVRAPGSPAQAGAKAAGGPAAGPAATAAAHSPESLVLEVLEDISPEAAVWFGWRHHHKTIVSLEIS